MYIQMGNHCICPCQRGVMRNTFFFVKIIFQLKFVCHKNSLKIFIFPPHFAAISDRCYFKFDHYCAWTNNVVGGLNHRWFMLFLVSVIAMCANAVIMSVNALINVTAIYQLMTLRYLDASGQPQPMTYRVLTQVSLFTYASQFVRDLTCLHLLGILQR